MKKIILLLITVLFFTGAVTAQDTTGYEPPFEWKSPEIMAQGSSYTANAAGYDSLFTNPAGFAVDNGDFNLITLQPTWVMNPFSFAEDMEAEDGEDPDIINAILNQVTTNGLGVGAQTSIGYVGHGLGLGVAVSVDSSFPQSETVLGASGEAWGTFALIGGYAFDFNLGGVKIALGADLRPMYRIRITDIDLNTASSFMDDEEEGEETTPLEDIPVLSGTGFGLDAGMKATWGWLTLGVSFRDIGGTTFTYEEATLQDYEDGTRATNSVAYEDTLYVTPASMRLGASIHPYIPLLSVLVDPIFHCEYTTYFVEEDYYDDGWEQGSAWSRLDLGTELTILKMLKLRGGYQGGYLSAGVGLKLWFLEVNAAVYSVEGGDYAGDDQTMAGSLDVSLRF